jgi:hypothetical protein
VYCPQWVWSLTLEVGFRAGTVKPGIRCKAICLLGVPDFWPWPEFAHFRGQREQNLVKLPGPSCSLLYHQCSILHTENRAVSVAAVSS